MYNRSIKSRRLPGAAYLPRSKQYYPSMLAPPAHSLHPTCIAHPGRRTLHSCTDLHISHAIKTKCEAYPSLTLTSNPISDSKAAPILHQWSLVASVETLSHRSKLWFPWATTKIECRTRRIERGWCSYQNQSSWVSLDLLIF